MASLETGLNCDTDLPINLEFGVLIVSLWVSGIDMYGIYDNNRDGIMFSDSTVIKIITERGHLDHHFNHSHFLSVTCNMQNEPFYSTKTALTSW